MKSHRAVLTLNVPARMDFVNITADVEKAVAESGIREGLCLVNAMHITASVFINDDEPGLHADYKRWLEQLAPFAPSVTCPSKVAPCAPSAPPSCHRLAPSRST